jgi:hypothetical protein
MCNHCGGKGMIRVCYQDGSPTDYAVCLCEASQWYRSDMNAGRHTGSYGWQVWAAREQVDPERIAMLEDLFNQEELANLGFPSGAEISSDDDLTSIGKTRKTKL